MPQPRRVPALAFRHRGQVVVGVPLAQTVPEPAVERKRPFEMFPGPVVVTLQVAGAGQTAPSPGLGALVAEAPGGVEGGLGGDSQVVPMAPPIEVLGQVPGELPDVWVEPGAASQVD